MSEMAKAQVTAMGMRLEVAGRSGHQEQWQET